MRHFRAMRGRQDKLTLLLFGLVIVFVIHFVVNRRAVSDVVSKTSRISTRDRLWKEIEEYNNENMEAVDFESILERVSSRDKMWQKITDYNKENRKNVKQRLPKVIGIGVKKCGTDGVINFLNHHPLVRIPKGMEMFFFNSKNTDTEYYRKRMPATNERQIAMEKTPIYFSEPPDNIPERIKSTIPDAKLVLIVCDPGPRAFSDYVHERIRFTYYDEEMVAKYETFDDYVDKYLPILQSKIEEWRKQHVSYELGNLRNNILELRHTDPAATILSNGIYTAHIRRWQSVFNHSNLMVIEGREFIDDPGTVMEELQDFIGLPKVLLREDFVKNPETGFFCYRKLTERHLQQNADEIDVEELKCLHPAKGRTRNNRKFLSSKTQEKLSAFYRPFNEQFYKDVGKNFGWL